MESNNGNIRRVNTVAMAIPNDIEIAIKSIGDEIDKNDEIDIFRPFFRSKKHRAGAPGFGLGLTICKKIVDAHKGALSLKTNGKETVFNIKIPMNGV